MIINVIIPKYIIKILENVCAIGLYEYKLIGVNPVRPEYGITTDLKKLQEWAKRYFSDMTIKKVNKEKKNYYGIFELTDPIVLQLEKSGILKR